MKLRELLGESTSKETALRAIISAVRRVTLDQIYTKLKDLATNYAANNGHLRGYPLIAGGMANRFFQQFFADRRSGLRILLETDFMQYLPDSARALLRPEFHFSKQLNSLKDVEGSFPNILAQIGRIIKSKELTDAANGWARARDDYYDYLDRLKAELENEEDAAPPVKKTTRPKDLANVQQRGQIEKLVNDKLNELPEKVRGEIRQAISRDDNKLMALQRELTKRDLREGITWQE